MVKFQTMNVEKSSESELVPFLNCDQHVVYLTSVPTSNHVLLDELASSE